LFVLNAVIVTLAVAIMLVAAARYANDARSETLGSTSYFTTEWRLLRQLKESTDRALSAKDAEIEELRERYQSLQRSGASASLLRSIDEAIREAEEGRAVILSARVSAYEGRDGAGGVVAGNGGSSSSRAVAAALATVAAVESAKPSPADAEMAPSAGRAPVGQPRPVASPSELLLNWIRDLESSLADEAARADSAEREILALRSALAEARAFEAFNHGLASDGAAETGASGAPGEMVPGSSGTLASDLMVDVAAELRRLSDAEPLIGMSDLRTRALLRAIVRDPAIRAEYPELFDSLDTYLERVEADAHQRGRAAAYEDILERLGATGR